VDDPDKWFTELYDEHHRRVFAYALANAGRDVAEDVASETFLIAWRRLDHVPDTPLPWLLGVARNLLRQQRYGGDRRRALAERVAALTTPEDLSVWDVADHVIERDSALAAIASLSERDLEVLTLGMWHGLSPGDAAKVVGCSAPAFFVRLHRARRRLARAFDNAPSPSRTRTASLAAARTSESLEKS
jgi:RNA polymerase sigma-70 factor (ECF subfamily)